MRFVTFFKLLKRHQKNPKNCPVSRMCACGAPDHLPGFSTSSPQKWHMFGDQCCDEAIPVQSQWLIGFVLQGLTRAGWTLSLKIKTLTGGGGVQAALVTPCTSPPSRSGVGLFIIQSE
jgi:hypothetical protein